MNAFTNVDIRFKHGWAFSKGLGLALSLLALSSSGAVSARTAESGANSVDHPSQILKTGIDLNAGSISDNSRQLADAIEITPVLEKIQELRARKVDLFQNGKSVTLEGLALRQDLTDSLVQSHTLIQKTMLEVDFVMSEIEAEENVYQELLYTYQDARDKTVARTNAASFATNGSLWAVAEALAIPTYKNSQYAISSGITGIIAGLVPTFFSFQAMRQVTGKKRVSEVEPNVLAKLFDYPVTPDIDYPTSVWRFLQSVPPGDPTGKTRRQQLIERWITDNNLPEFTDATSRKQLDVITASASHKKGLSIATLNTRLVMLQQLEGEVLKMKRMLLEISMVSRGEKSI
jgi:hypothetical protein